MRGKAQWLKDKVSGFGITPAYAGKRGVCDMILYVWQDHPRLCGEKSMVSVVLLSPSGSPPPMRGKVVGKKPDAVEHRITPAYAGKSRS